MTWLGWTSLYLAVGLGIYTAVDAYNRRKGTKVKAYGVFAEGMTATLMTVGWPLVTAFCLFVFFKQFGRKR